MYSLKQRLAAFMYGRYGVDTMYFGLLAAYVLLACLKTLLGFDLLFNILMWLVLIYGIFRVFSRNIAARRAENEAFLRIWGPSIQWCKTIPSRIRDRKIKRYRTCPGCKTILRLPYKKGKHTVVCPKCKTRFEVKIRF